MSATQFANNINIYNKFSGYLGIVRKTFQICASGSLHDIDLMQ